MDGVLIEAQGGDRYRVNLPTGPVDVVGAEAAVLLAEGGLRSAWEKAKHPRARGGLFASVPDHSAPPKPKGRPMPRVIDHTGPRPGSVPDRTGARGRPPKDVPSSKLKNRVDPEKDLPSAPPKGKETAPAEPLGSPGRPVQTDDVVEAAKQLAAGKYVQLTSKNQVSTLLKELQREVQSAREKGDKAPDINLCKVTVKGTSLFCVESKGVPRIQMPQLKGDATTVKAGSRASKLTPDKRGEVSVEAQFRDHLIRHGVAVEDGEELASHLKATQNELNGAKVAGIANAMDNGTMIEGPGLFISRDNYVVDGHHRWAATIGVDYEDGKDDLKMPVQRIDMDIIDVLLQANRFAEDWGLPQAGVGDFSAKMLAGLEGAPPPLGSDASQEPRREAQRTQQGKWRAEMPDGRRLDFASRELAEGALRREWDKIKHPRGRAGRFRDVPGSGAEKAKLTDALALGRGRSALFSPGRATTTPGGFGWPVVKGPDGKSYPAPMPFSPGRAGMPGRQSDLRHEIDKVLASPDRQLGMSREEAARLRDRIGDADLGDDDALRAYDLLHSRAVTPLGRAFSPGRSGLDHNGMTREQAADFQSDRSYPFFASPGRAAERARVPSVKHAMGFEPGDYLVPTRSFSVPQGRGYSQLTGDVAAFHPWHRYRVKQIIGTNQLTVEGDQPGTELYIPTFDKSSVRREKGDDLPKRVGSPALDGQRVPHSPGRAVGPDEVQADRLKKRSDTFLKANPGWAAAKIMGGGSSIFSKYDDEGLRTALKDPQLTGERRRAAEREARRRGIGAAESRGIGVTEPTTQSGRDDQARRIIGDFEKRAASMGEGEYYMKLGWLRKHGYAEGTGPWRESLTSKARALGREASPGRAGGMTPAETKAWVARENKIRDLVDQHVQADRDEDEPRRERIQRELEKLGLNVEHTGAGWMITR